MGVMADQLANMRRTVSSPDGQLTAELRGNRLAGLTFQGNTYRYYTERTLERQLSRLALRLWTSYQRGYDEAITAATGEPVDRDTRTWDARRRRFRQAQAAAVSRGMSPNEWIYVETTGMVTWHVVIRDGALTALDEAAFVTEVFGAYRAMTDDYRAQVRQLRADHYGEPLPTRPSDRKDLAA